MEEELLEKVKLIICAEECVSPDMVFTKTRQREVKEARQLIAYFGRKYIKGADNKPLSFEKIGHFIRQDHATVIHTCKTIDGWASTDRFFREKIEEYDKKMKDFSGLVNLNVSLLLSEKIKRQMKAIKKDCNLLDEIIAKLGINEAV